MAPGMAWRILLLLPLALASAIFGLRWLRPLPTIAGRAPETALPPADTAPLDRLVAPLEARNPGLSGVLPLADPEDAFAARVRLVREARRSLDVQYYIWNNDVSGNLLALELIAAADRGVRVRLLLDDNGSSGIDGAIAALHSHPNASVRLFNPFPIRWPKTVGYLTDFHRLNRRMHNKALVADNRLAIVGGRNIGDAYFGACAENLFEDLDVVLAGPVVRELSHDFDCYWSCGSAHGADTILRRARPRALARLRAAVRRRNRSPRALAYARAVARSALVASLQKGQAPFQWVPVRLVSDDPAKGLGQAGDDALLAHGLADLVGEPATRFSLVSPYFVPTRSGCEALAALARRGVAVTVLTNALEATDVAAVHAGYQRYRRPLLEAGVRLFELRRAGSSRGRRRLALGIGSRSGSRRRPAVASAGTALHAKTFEVDGRILFVGSFNFDPRSVRLNTELGFVIESPELARQLCALIDRQIAAYAYEVRLDEHGRLVWIEWRDGTEIVHRREPGTRLHQRALVAAVGRLPIEWML